MIRAYASLCWLAVKMLFICVIGYALSWSTPRTAPVRVEFDRLVKASCVVWVGVLAGPLNVEASRRDVLDAIWWLKDGRK